MDIKIPAESSAEPSEKPASQEPKCSVTIDPVQYAWNLPKFNGAPEDLKTFIDAVDILTPILEKYDDDAAKIIGTIIKTKLVGKARPIINLKSKATVWSEIRPLLIDSICGPLKIDLFDEEIRGNQTIRSYFNSIQSKLIRMIVKTEVKKEKGWEVEVNFHRTLALDTLTHRIPARQVRIAFIIQKPKTFEEARDILIDCEFMNRTLNYFIEKEEQEERENEERQAEEERQRRQQQRQQQRRNRKQNQYCYGRAF